MGLFSRNKGFSIRGLDKVVHKLNVATGKLPKVVKAGLVRAALVIQGESQNLTPVDTGNLRAGAFVVADKRGQTGTQASQAIAKFRGTPKEKAEAERRHKGVIAEARAALPPNAVIVGHSAAYALFVHEDMEAAHTSGQAKYLQTAIVQNKRKILAAIALGKETIV